ncbi:MAG: type II secretion system F family protein [Armatimonadetes bacterium]|nr:type II secretion system F family protein [Armatimonadota bacterium]
MAQDELLQLVGAARRLRGEESREWRERVRCSPEQLILLTRQLATMLAAGIHLVESLRVLSRQAAEPELVEVLWTVQDSIAGGCRLSQALARFPAVFSPLYRAMVVVGENSGALVHCLGKLADWAERDYRLVRRVRQALVYPSMLLLLAAALSLWLFGQVLPPFLRLMEGMQVPLPWTTRAMIGVVSIASSPAAWLGLLCLVLLAVLWLRELSENQSLVLRFSRLVLRLPLLGKVLSMIHQARFAAAASTLLSAGTELIRAWQLALRASGSPVLAAEADALARVVEQGGQASELLISRAGLFCPLLGHLVRAGEETGRLPAMLQQAQELLEREAEYRLEVLTALLEPAILLFVSAGLAFVLLATLLPLYSYLGSLG